MKRFHSAHIIHCKTYQNCCFKIIKIVSPVYKFVKVIMSTTDNNSPKNYQKYVLFFNNRETPGLFLIYVTPKGKHLSHCYC